MAARKKRGASAEAAEAATLGGRTSARMARRIEVWPIDRLRPYERNARTHSASQVAQIAASIARFGFNAPILVDGADGIVAGHGRLAAARHLELTEVPVVVLDHLDQTERRAYLLADNRLSDLAGWDDVMLMSELADLEGLGVDPGVMGFDSQDIDGLARAVNASASVREVPPAPLPRAPVSRPGDLWHVGRHRILCGDARNLGDLDRLLGGERVEAVVTDPPYGIEYVGKTSAALRIQNDGADGLAELLGAAFTGALLKCRPGAPWYVFCPTGAQFIDFLQVLMRLGVFRQTCVWVKDRMTLGRQDYHQRHEGLIVGATPAPAGAPELAYSTEHEWIAYGWAPGGPHRPPPTRTWDTVWEFSRPSASRDRPTMKPLELIGQCVDHAAAPGRLVLDLFAGSGTTAVACEQLGRISASLELDPRYTDVAVLRLAEASGAVPLLDGSATWTEVLAQRAS